MADSELKCLNCQENISILAGKNEKFSVFCIANDRCVEKEDKSLKEKFLCGLPKKQFEIFLRLMDITLITPLREL